MHKFGRYHRHFGLGGIIMQSKVSKVGPRRIFFLDLKKCQIYLRVQQPMPEGADEEEFLESLVEMVDEMRDAVEAVAGFWRGLGLDFDEDVTAKNLRGPVSKRKALRRRPMRLSFREGG